MYHTFLESCKKPRRKKFLLRYSELTSVFGRGSMSPIEREKKKDVVNNGGEEKDDVDNNDGVQKSGNDNEKSLISENDLGVWEIVADSVNVLLDGRETSFFVARKNLK